jgi:hypothetical protein
MLRVNLSVVWLEVDSFLNRKEPIAVVDLFLESRLDKISQSKRNISISWGEFFVGAGFIPARIAALIAFRAGINPAPTLLFFSSIVKLPRFIEKIQST